MTDLELKRLSRADLLELLLKEHREKERLQAELEQVHKELADRRILLKEAGSIAEAALRLNGVFEAAEAAAAQYVESLRLLAEEQKDEETQYTDTGNADHTTVGG